jgi:uncharacterized protein DUF2752
LRFAICDLRFEDRGRLGPDEIDHELIWGWVGLTCLVMGSAAIVRAGLPPIACPFRALTGIPCVTCGATRAFAALVNGDLPASLRLHPLVVPGVFAAALYIPYALSAAHLGGPRLRIATSERERTWARMLTVAALLVVWIYLIAVGR